MKKAQIAVEFMMLMITGFFLMFTLLIILNHIFVKNVDERVHIELENLGRSLQQELLLASEMETGFERTFVLPEKINGREYSIELGNSSSNKKYLAIKHNYYEHYFIIPMFNGTITKGNNTIQKTSTSITITK